MNSHIDALTHAEAKVLALVDAGLSNRSIAETMSITIGTVKTHLHRSYEKLDARHRLDALAKARAQGRVLPSVEALV